MMGKQMDRRVALEAVVAGVITGGALVAGGLIVMGMAQTKAYVPDLIDTYASVDYLQQKVSFGQTGSQWPAIAIGSIASILMGMIYYRVRSKYKRQASPPS